MAKKQRRTQRTFVKKGKPLSQYMSSSPYWDWIFNSKRVKDSLEQPTSNPDILSNENSLQQVHTDQQEIENRKTVLKELLKVAIKRSKLTVKQYKYINLVFYEGQSLTEIAEHEKVSIATVSISLKNAIKKIKRIADKEAKNL